MTIWPDCIPAMPDWGDCNGWVLRKRLRSGRGGLTVPGGLPETWHPFCQWMSELRKEDPMQDVIFVAATIGFFAASVLYTYAFGRI